MADRADLEDAFCKAAFDLMPKEGTPPEHEEARKSHAYLHLMNMAKFLSDEELAHHTRTLENLLVRAQTIRHQ